jgi:two-component system response regulator DesR
MAAERAHHFDPDLIDLFLEAIDDLLDIRDAHPEPVPAHSISVLIIEPRAMFADALGRLLGQAEGISVLGVVTTAGQGVEIASERRTDVVIVDVSDGDAVAAVQEVRAKLPDSAVIVLSGGVDEFLRLRTIEAGGAGVVERDRALDDLLPAVFAAAAGDEPVIGRSRLPGG